MALRIGQVARQAGISVQAVRFYEKEGLLPKPARRPSGYREYPESVVRRLLFIRRAKELGFSLREIRELFALRVEPGATCGDVQARVLDKVAEVERKIADLERIRDALRTLAASCSQRGPTSECPILDVLDGRALEGLGDAGDGEEPKRGSLASVATSNG